MFNICSSHSSHREHYIGEYLLLKTIKKGPSSEVRWAQHILTGAHVVVKAIRRKGISRFFEEVHCFKRVSHPNITKLFEVLVTPDKYFLVMEHVGGGNLLEYLEDNGPMDEGEARTIFRQVVSAVQHCHQKGVIHRDLTPDNILIEVDDTIKLSDFHFSTQVREDTQYTFCGSINYSAPEILKRNIYDGRKADVWSLGVLLYKILTGVTPFAGDNIAEVKSQILSGNYQVPSFMSGRVQRLLKKLLTVDPNKRPTMEDVMKDPWVNKGHKKILKPYREPPRGELDPQIMKTMLSLGCIPDYIQESLAQRKFDHLMGTYLILRTMKTKMPGRKIRVKPFRTSYTSSSSTTASSQEGARLFDKKTKQPSIPSKSLRLRVTTTQPTLDTMTTTASESSTDTSIKDIRYSVEIGRSSESSSSSTTSSSGGDAHRSSPAWQEVARRAFQFLLKFVCCGSSAKKEHRKRSKIRTTANLKLLVLAVGELLQVERRDDNALRLPADAASG
ncbi:serine/threonine-protein kinase MARK2-like [Myotis myotis]|uniref:serine/threonine-protein kinase MARK2-like n=1 Tax=Myotis myotis TaxID=51298 RepID=UPI00174A603C|nr:serine/threonine-protein kinase MARK2-like [Myotis myotis]